MESEHLLTYGHGYELQMIRPIAIFSALVLLGATATSAAPERVLPTSPINCPALQGASNLVESGKRFVIVGEMHGTSETPALFGDLVCAFARARPVSVVLEFDEQSTPALQRYINSPGTPADVEQLLQSEIWDPGLADGRSSEAMLALLKRLQRLRSAGLPVQVYGGQPRAGGGFDQHYYELEMAARWVNIASLAPDSVVLILAGRIHGMLQPAPGLGFQPAASFLLQSDTISLRAEPSGGAAWNCQNDGCHSHPLVGHVSKPRFVGLLGVVSDGANGTYSVGSPFTASPPVKQ